MWIIYVQANVKLEKLKLSFISAGAVLFLI